MDNNIVLSVIVPIYNGEKHLRRALDSLRNQNIEKAQFLLIDDCSSDLSFDICIEYEALDSRFYVTRNDKNYGVSYSRNRGLSLAKGKYLTFLDCDDWCCKDGYDKMLNELENNHLDFIAANGKTVFENNLKKTRSMVGGNLPLLFNKEEAIKYVFSRFGYKGFLGNKIYKTDIIINQKIKLVEDIYFCEDSCFLIDYLVHCKRCGYINIDCYNYWIDGNNTVERPFSEKQFSFMKAFEYMKVQTKALGCQVRKAIITDHVSSCLYMTKKAVRDKKNDQFIRKMQKVVKSYCIMYIIQHEISIKLKVYALIDVIFPYALKML